MTYIGFLEDLPDERRACIKSIFHYVNQEEIKEIWDFSSKYSKIQAFYSFNE